jgi:hypothetical protein
MCKSHSFGCKKQSIPQVGCQLSLPLPNCTQLTAQHDVQDYCHGAATPRLWAVAWGGGDAADQVTGKQQFNRANCMSTVLARTQVHTTDRSASCTRLPPWCGRATVEGRGVGVDAADVESHRITAIQPHNL